MAPKTIDDVIANLTARCTEIQKEYNEQSANTQAPGNPYVVGLSGHIAGLTEALFQLSLLKLTETKGE